MNNQYDPNNPVTFYQDSRTVSIVAGVQPPDFTIPPGALTSVIAYIDIDNTESAVPVQLYIGQRTAAQVITPGVAIKTIAAYTRQSYNINPEQFCCLHWPTVPTQNASIQIQWQDKFQSAVVGVAQVITTTSTPFPLGAVPFAASPGGTWTSGSASTTIFVTPGVSIIGKSVYVTDLVVQGVDRQAIQWQCNVIDADGSTVMGTPFTGNSGENLNFHTAIPTPSAKSTQPYVTIGVSIHISAQKPSDIVGLLYVDLYVAGYYL